MRADPFANVDYLGEPVIISRGYQLCALLKVCERAASSLENVGDGPYRDSITRSLTATMELAESVAFELLIALEQAQGCIRERG